MKYAARGAVICLCLVALFWRLDGTVLWRDEASTACWGRAMVEHRSLVPRVFDGKRLIAQAADGHDFNDQFLPVMQGWLQFYVAALSFLLGGTGTVAVRLPFVLAGALSLWLLWRAGRELSLSEWGALAAPVSGATSIYFLTAARQCRYYVLVVLFSAWIFLELARYLKNPELARRWSFYARLGVWGVLVYLANYVSFGGLWASLAVFVLLTRDRVLIRRFAALTAVLAVPLAVEFFLVHASFVASAAKPIPWRIYWEVVQEHGNEIERMIPLLAIAPAAWYLFARRKQTGPIAQMTLLAAVVIVVSVLFTIFGTRGNGIARYYFQVVTAAILLTGLLAERLAALAGRGWAVAFFAFAVLWPNLNLYHGWSAHVVERQFAKDRTNNEPMIDFLRNHVRREETVAFYRNVQGMTAYFYLPWLQWVDLLDSDEPRNRRLRGILPDYAFDDYAGVDWYVVWDNGDKMPKKLTPDYQLVWEYHYTEPVSLWDWQAKPRPLSYKMYHRAAGGGTRR